MSDGLFPGPLYQWQMIHGVAAAWGLVTAVFMHGIARRNRRDRGVFDAARMGAIVGLWSACLFGTAAMLPRVFVDDYAHVSVLTSLMWIGWLLAAWVYVQGRRR